MDSILSFMYTYYTYNIRPQHRNNKIGELFAMQHTADVTECDIYLHFDGESGWGTGFLQ